MHPQAFSFEGEIVFENGPSLCSRRTRYSKTPDKALHKNSTEKYKGAHKCLEAVPESRSNSSVFESLTFTEPEETNGWLGQKAGVLSDRKSVV